ncbi:MAG: shikimate kinase [Bacteroidetes bacterium 4572_112]|nr:MAG: shikimate kinase [Bacteroidetes bacterium 4572_112]
MNNIFLMGYMASGKTTLGKELAQHLNKKFIDLDKYIELAEGKTISQLFTEIGEDAFREMEHNYLMEVSENNDNIIALGGGTPCFFNNLEIINASGTSYYLKVPAYIIQQRIENDSNKRPLLDGMDEFEMLEYIQQHMGDRELYYLRADKIFSGKNKSDLFNFVSSNT